MRLCKMSEEVLIMGDVKEDEFCICIFAAACLLEFFVYHGYGGCNMFSELFQLINLEGHQEVTGH